MTRNDPDGSCGTPVQSRTLAAIRIWSGNRETASDGGGAMREDLDYRIHDAVALDEISLYGDVLSAVAAADRRLTDDELDEVLGLDRQVD
jgi:hypothetical protein